MSKSAQAPFTWRKHSAPDADRGRRTRRRSSGGRRLRPRAGLAAAARLEAETLYGEWTGPRESFVVDTIVPWTDAHLPTIRSCSGRAGAGLSAGAYGAVDIALRHPRLFACSRAGTTGRSGARSSPPRSEYAFSPAA
ncbi:MAG TPA: alpha/beta hydrolase-fold protein [Gaiellaceae bacterium]|nr:alpha/beta hydrolase-fold protein [Gaiellaceae bacterium]